MPEQDKKSNDSKEQSDDLTDLSSSAEAAEPGAAGGVPPLAQEEEVATEDAPDAESHEEQNDTSLDAVSSAETNTIESDDEVTPFDDEKTERAIDEIVAKEGDDLLAAEDATRLATTAKIPQKKRSFFRNKWIRFILFLLVFGGITASMVVPKTRYWILNTAGVRSTSSIVVVDSTTQLPLKGVSVSLAGQERDTDSDGMVKFANLKLGPSKLIVHQVGFEEIKRNLVIGWGSNPLGSFALKASGVQYVIEVHDYLSDQPLEGVEASDGVTTALSDKKGKITLTVESALTAKDGVTLSKAGYRSDKITLNEDPDKPTKAPLVLARKAVFITKQSGKYDVFKSDIDGTAREVLLPGTGHENSNISLVVSPDGKRAALVSTRDNKRDSSGFLLSSIVLINVEDGRTLTIAEGSQIQLIDWIGSRLIFQLVSSAAAAGSRYTVVAYDYSDNTRLQLAAASALTAVSSAQGLIYYAVEADSANPSSQPGFFRIKPDGSGKQRMIEGELDTVLRSTYGTFSLQTQEGMWYSYDIAAGSKSQIASPTNLANRMYIDNADRSRSLWVSQGSLMGYEIASAKDSNVKTQGGLAYPVQWLSDTAVVYRVSSGNETADYAMSLLGGVAHKLSDVAPTYGFAQSQ